MCVSASAQYTTCKDRVVRVLTFLYSLNTWAPSKNFDLMSSRQWSSTYTCNSDDSEAALLVALFLFKGPLSMILRSLDSRSRSSYFISHEYLLPTVSNNLHLQCPVCACASC